MSVHNKKIPLINSSEKKMYTIFFFVILFLFVVCTAYTEYNIFEVIANSGYCWEFLLNDFFSPIIPSASKMPNIFSSVLTTIAMAVSATTVAGIMAFFVSFFESEHISPFPKAAKVVRGFVTFLRNIPALVWAFILFSSFGIGTGVGFIALTITSFAFMVRAFVETMEDVSQDCIESLQAVGANFPQRVIHGVIPSAINSFLSWFLYCIEVNIRASTIVGMVGGGGIGLVLFSYIKSFKYSTASTIILLIAIMVILVDLLTGKLRKEVEK